jgi:hypothetical protein
MIGLSIGICATLIGFIGALIIDFPPVHIISACIFILGFGLALIANVYVKRF